jgi:hypothetical protein
MDVFRVSAHWPLVELAAIAHGAEDPDPQASQSGPRQVTFRVQRGGTPLLQPLTVHLESPTGTASQGEDYSGWPSSVTIPANESSQTFLLNVNDDDEIEPVETILGKLAPDPQGIYAFADPQNPPAEAQINDNDYEIVQGQFTFNNSQGVLRDDGTGAYETASLARSERRWRCR